MVDANAPIYGCRTCATTAGRMGCPVHSGLQVHSTTGPLMDLSQTGPWAALAEVHELRTLLSGIPGDTLAEQVAALLQDRAFIEWLASQTSVETRAPGWEYSDEDGCVHTIDTWTVFGYDEDGCEGMMGHGDTLRAALTEAMGGEHAAARPADSP